MEYVLAESDLSFWAMCIQVGCIVVSVFKVFVFLTSLGYV